LTFSSVAGVAQTAQLFAVLKARSVTVAIDINTTGPAGQADGGISRVAPALRSLRSRHAGSAAAALHIGANFGPTFGTHSDVAVVANASFGLFVVHTDAVTIATGPLAIRRSTRKANGFIPVITFTPRGPIKKHTPAVVRTGYAGTLIGCTSQTHRDVANLANTGGFPVGLDAGTAA
jgi:hypothetical protein